MAGTAGRSGRRPKPTARKELAGNPGKRALNKEEPVFTPIKGVAPPDWFSEDEGLPMAAVMWELTTKELCGQGLLCVTDLAVLERWCVAYEFWRRAVKNIAREGLSITGAMGGKIKNPELTAKKEQEPETLCIALTHLLRRRINSARERTALPVETRKQERLPLIWMTTISTCCRKNWRE